MKNPFHQRLLAKQTSRPALIYLGALLFAGVCDYTAPSSGRKTLPSNKWLLQMDLFMFGCMIFSGKFMPPSGVLCYCVTGEKLQTEFSKKEIRLADIVFCEL